MEFTDINKELDNGENMGSLVQKVYFGLYDDVASWPTKPVEPATPEENGALAGNITMKTGKRLFEMYITDDTGEFSIEPVGEKDGKSFVMHLSFFHPTLNKKILGFMNIVKNDNMVFIAEDSNHDQFLLGDEYWPATYEGAPDGAGTGKETAARRGVSMEFTYKTANVYQYTGVIPLTIASS